MHTYKCPVHDEILTAMFVLLLLSTWLLIWANLSNPDHMRSTVKFVLLLACLIVIPYIAESSLSTNQNYIKHISGLLSINQYIIQVLTIITNHNI